MGQPQPARVALVTGASDGIGRACADRLAGAGWTVTGASRRGTAGTDWPGLVMNVDDEAAVKAGVAGIIDAHGRLDALIAAAGWGVAGAVEHTALSEAQAQFDTNFWGCVRAVQAVLPQMRAQGSGRIVLISSLGGVLGIPFQAFYSAYEVAPFGIEVTLVQPGNIKTGFTAARKMAAAAEGDEVYGAALTKAVGVMERDEVNGAPADVVAAAVERVLAARRPPRRVSAGKTAERVSVLAKRVLPFRVFEAAAKGSLGVG
jgi:NAD(P)-dependent dehydrogenase (short-subunit alcohol dehydrogenase family)